MDVLLKQLEHARANVRLQALTAVIVVFNTQLTMDVVLKHLVQNDLRQAYQEWYHQKSENPGVKAML